MKYTKQNILYRATLYVNLRNNKFFELESDEKTAPGFFFCISCLLLVAGCSCFRNDMQMQWVSKASLVFQGVTLRNSGRLVGRCRTSRAVHLSAEDLYPEAEVVLLPIPDSRPC